MKELSIEEKAKRYGEAIERARALNNAKDTCEYIFPELKESEDERIRKALLRFFREHQQEWYAQGFAQTEVVAWLEKQCEHQQFNDNFPSFDDAQGTVIVEKQGEREPKFRIGDTIKKKSTGDIVTVSEVDLKNSEYRLSNTGFIPFKYEYLWELVEQKPAEWHREDEQNLNACLGYIPDEFLRKWLTDTIHAKYDKPADRVEPKFKVGDWVAYNYNPNLPPKKIIQITNKHYVFDDCSFEIKTLEIDWHLWTIEDAKDGDVLAFYYDYRSYKMIQVGIIEKYVGKHGGCSNTFKIYVGLNWENNLQIGQYMGCYDIRPATKEQRDTLIEEMANAEYTFDFEKKELKKMKNISKEL